MLHWAYWHYRAVGISFSPFWTSISTGEADLEEDLEVDLGFGILVGP